MMTTASDIVAETIAIHGVGLLGGSLAAALKQRRLVRHVIGVGRRVEKLQPALQAGLLDEISEAPLNIAARADVHIFCTPVDRIVQGVREIARVCRPGTLITDVGSVKGMICEPLSTGLPEGIEFIGSHPMAGSEKSGYEYANPHLFEGRVCVVTPVPSSSPQTQARVTYLWEAVGARVLIWSPADHDRAVAETSHLPHVVASVLAGSLTPSHRPLAARGFEDTTRIAAGDAELWLSILMANSAEVLRAMDRYAERFAEFRQALQAGDQATLLRLWRDGIANRDNIG